MPVAFSPPPFPNADIAIVAAADPAADATSIAADAFALLLLAAGGDPVVTGGKDPGAASRMGRWPDTRGGNMLADPGIAPAKLTARDPLSPLEIVKGDDPAALAPPANAEISPDPAALTAALSAAIVSSLKSDALLPRAVAAKVAPSDSPTLILQSGPARVDAGGPPAAAIPLPSAVATQPAAATPLAPAVATRASELLAIAAAPKEVPEAQARTVNETNDAGGSIYSAQSTATSQLAPLMTPATVHTIETPVTAPGWEGEFAGKLAQVITLRNDRAEFHLHPADLGPIDIRISFASDQAVVLITAVHATTRDALEQALPHLRDMLADQGIALGQASVQGERNPAEHGGATQAMVAEADPAAPRGLEPTIRTVRLKGLVDVFA
jgi:flagellar hook-length control protein FliK